MPEEPLLVVEGLKKHYPIRSGLLSRVTGHIKAVDGVSFEVRDGETVGLVGESGCGKSTTATTILGLEEATGGSVTFDGLDVTGVDAADDETFRRRVQVVFQDPNSAFDPRMTVGESVREPLELNGMPADERADAIVADLFERIGLTADDVDRYPNEFSDGEKQRIALARALVLNPDLLIADEPVSALDVSVQAKILSLLEDLRTDLGLSVLFISHDLGVVREICDRVGVMYLGEIVEMAPTESLFEHPKHPYTEALLDAIPDPDPRYRGEKMGLPGDVPDPSEPPAGCSFHPRCPRVIPPEDFDLSTDVFRRVLDFRLAVEAGDVTPDDVTVDTPRAANDLPETLPDPAAEGVLADAIEDLAGGDVDSAESRLAEAFTSVCQREDPALVSTGDERRAACHLPRASATETDGQ